MQAEFQSPEQRHRNRDSRVIWHAMFDPKRTEGFFLKIKKQSFWSNASKFNEL